MILQLEAAKTVVAPDAKAIELSLGKLRIAGRHEHASLEDAHGNYLQVAGGNATCMLEMRSVNPLCHYRAYQDKKNSAFPDGTKLRISGGEIALNSNEWFSIAQVTEVFLQFSAGAPLPVWLKWRNISHLVLAAQ